MTEQEHNYPGTHSLTNCREVSFILFFFMVIDRSFIKRIDVLNQHRKKAGTIKQFKACTDGFNSNMMYVIKLWLKVKFFDYSNRERKNIVIHNIAMKWISLWDGWCKWVSRANPPCLSSITVHKYMFRFWHPHQFNKRSSLMWKSTQQHHRCWGWWLISF